MVWKASWEEKRTIILQNQSKPSWSDRQSQEWKKENPFWGQRKEKTAWEGNKRNHRRRECMQRGSRSPFLEHLHTHRIESYGRCTKQTFLRYKLTMQCSNSRSTFSLWQQNTNAPQAKRMPREKETRIQWERERNWHFCQYGNPGRPCRAIQCSRFWRLSAPDLILKWALASFLPFYVIILHFLPGYNAEKIFVLAFHYWLSH